MRKELLKYLVCPYTKEDLVLHDAVMDGDEIKSGKLVSKKSKNTYSIVDYVPVMLDAKTRKTLDRYNEWAKQWRNKKFEFNRNDDDMGIPLKLQRDRYHFDDIDMQKKVVWEAGCGGGRLTKAFYDKSVEAYLALDITHGVYEARAKHKNLPNMHFIQGDIAYPPFRDKSVDVCVVLGVIQHTKDPQETIYGIGKTLKIDGLCVASIYMRPKNVFVRFKLWYTDLIRATFRVLHVPEGVVLAWAKLSILAFNRSIIFRPLAWAFFQQATYNKSDKFVWMLNYDFYHPNTYQYSVSREDTQQMFLHAGMTPLLEPAGKESENSYVFRKGI